MNAERSGLFPACFRAYSKGVVRFSSDSALFLFKDSVIFNAMILFLCTSLKLRIIQFSIESILCKKFFMISLFYDISVFHKPESYLHHVLLTVYVRSQSWFFLSSTGPLLSGSEFRFLYLPNLSPHQGSVS